MIVKGTPAAGGQRLADHINRTDTNERVEVKELRGVAADNLRDALLEMEAVGSGSRTKRPFYHASVNTLANEKLTDAQRIKAIDRLEQELGLTGQPRVVVVHEKKDREHCHVVWLRVDIDSMTAIRADHNFRKHEIVARELEREFGHTRVQGAHIEREDGPRPPRTPSHAEMQQAERTGISPKEAKAHITAIWQRTDTGASFQTELEKSGWVLARGDRRDFVTVDPRGGVHSLSRRIDGATAKDVRARLADVAMSRLPSVAEGRAVQVARHGLDKQPAKTAARETPQKGKEAVRVIGGVVVGASRATKPAGRLLKAAGKLADSVANAFEGLLGGGPSQAKGSTPADEKIPLDRGKAGPRVEIDEAVQQDVEQKSQRRQRYLKDFSREVPAETERDADMEKDRNGRERTRGE